MGCTWAQPARVVARLKSGRPAGKTFFKCRFSTAVYRFILQPQEVWDHQLGQDVAAACSITDTRTRRAARRVIHSCRVRRIQGDERHDVRVPPLLPPQLLLLGMEGQSNKLLQRGHLWSSTTHPSCATTTKSGSRLRDSRLGSCRVAAAAAATPPPAAAAARGPGRMGAIPLPLAAAVPFACSCRGAAQACIPLSAAAGR